MPTSTRNPTGNPLIDPAGRVTTLTHDSAGNLIAIEAPDQMRTTFSTMSRPAVRRVFLRDSLPAFPSNPTSASHRGLISGRF
jgi:YD repeat-containing protein